MRRFTDEYLTATRAGMWGDSRVALEPLSLADREHILDVGCGTGELTHVLAEESPGTVTGVDADRVHLSGRAAGQQVLAGDACRLPFRNDVFDLVVCQALLINLPDPAIAVREFDRLSNDLVAAIEPDNGRVQVDSTVQSEAGLSRRARTHFLSGVETDVTLGGTGVRKLFEESGLADIRTCRYDQVRTIEPPYDESALIAARRMATGTGIETDRETLLSGELTAEEYDDLRSEWRTMGRSVVDQMRVEEYRRRETVPFFVTVGRVRTDSGNRK